VKTLDRPSVLFAFDGWRRSFTKAMVDELDADQTKAALSTARSLLASLGGLIEKLEAKVG
jgi:hypothetical protein